MSTAAAILLVGSMTFAGAAFVAMDYERVWPLGMQFALVAFFLAFHADRERRWR